LLGIAFPEMAETEGYFDRIVGMGGGRKGD